MKNRVCGSNVHSTTPLINSLNCHMQWHRNLGAGEQMLPQLLHWGATNTFCSPIFTQWVSQFSSELLKTCKLSVIVSLHHIHNRSAINSEVSILNYIAGEDWQPIKYSILANSDECILAALDVQHYLHMFYVTCMLNSYSTNIVVWLCYQSFTQLYTDMYISRLTYVYISPLSLSYRKDIYCTYM